MQRIKIIIKAIVVLILSSNSVHAQVQIGADINGEAAFDESGKAVEFSANGTRVAIGAMDNSGNGFMSGHVRVYELTSGNWVQIGSDINGDTTECDAGASIALSSNGDRIIVGAPRYSYFSGYAGVYEYSAGNWVLVGNIINAEGFGDQAGIAVDISANGNRIVVGSPLNDGNGSDAGHARIYELSGGNWIQVGNDIDGIGADYEMGYSVSLSSDGNRVAVSSPFVDGPGNVRGLVSVFELIGGSWVQMGADIYGVNDWDASGWEISMSHDGNNVAVGAPFHAGNGITSTGQVRVFEWNGTNWLQKGADIYGILLDVIGKAVSLSADGNRLIVGTIENDNFGMDAGYSMIFEFIGNSWVKIGTDIGGSMGDWSGQAVAISADGNSAAIGSVRGSNNFANSGFVRVYDLSSIQGIAPINSEDVILYPNPSTGFIQIEEMENGDMLITDVNGKTVKAGVFTNSMINITELKSGTYFLSVSHKGKLILTKKVIKK